MLVTGAAGGIGLACATRAAREGAVVVLADINASAAEAAAKGIVEAGGCAIGVGADITRREDCTRMVAAAVTSFGGLDVEINNAGVMDGGRDGPPAALHLANDIYLRRTIEINVMGTMFACAAELAVLVEQGRGGALVNVGSITGLTGSAGTPAYVASKHAVNGLTRSIAIDHAPYGIRCNLVNMSATETPLLPRDGLRDIQTHGGPAGRAARGSEARGPDRSPVHRLETGRRHPLRRIPRCRLHDRRACGIGWRLDGIRTSPRRFRPDAS